MTICTIPCMYMLCSYVYITGMLLHFYGLFTADCQPYQFDKSSNNTNLTAQFFKVTENSFSLSRTKFVIELITSLLRDIVCCLIFDL